MGQFLLSMCRWLFRAPTPLESILWPVTDSILVPFGQVCNFRNPNLVTFYLCMYLILIKEHFTFHLQYKHSGTFANREYKELSYPKIQNLMCDPILVTLLKMRPPDSQSSRENPAGTSLLASYKEVPPRLRRYHLKRKLRLFYFSFQFIVKDLDTLTA